MNKKCVGCSEVLATDLFYLSKTTSDGFMSKCKKCTLQTQKKRNDANKDAIRIRNKKYNEDKKLYISINKKIYYQKNIDLIKEKQKIYRKTKVKWSLRSDIWRKQNLDRVNEYWRFYHNKKKKDVQYKLKKVLRSRLKNALNHNLKTGSAVNNLGCSVEELKLHLESKFQPGMNWDNHGDWHIDHIKPLASFDLTKEDDLNLACHYTNLQPLWAIDNLIKKDKYKE